MATDRDFMRLAIETARNSQIEEGRTSPAPKVGAVLVKDGEVLGVCARGETGPGDHAEYGLLIKRLDGVDLSGATIYTTLEPCSRRGPDRTPCAEHLINARISTVFIGSYDPNPTIYRAGWRMLRDAGVILRDFPADLRAEIAVVDQEFVDSFVITEGDHGAARFDYTQNAGRHMVMSTFGAFETQWTTRGTHSIYARDNAHHVALARYAEQFEEIDDPGAFDFRSYSTGVNEGEIAVFRNDLGYLLVRVTHVDAGPDYGSDHWELCFEYETRPLAVSLEREA